MAPMPIVFSRRLSCATTRCTAARSCNGPDGSARSSSLSGRAGESCSERSICPRSSSWRSSCSKRRISSRGSPPWQWVPELAQAPGEALVHKRFNSSFEQTSLDEELAKLGATHLVLAGAASNWCIRATAYGALDRGYDVTLVKDAHTTESMELGGGVTIHAASVIQELNIAMKWLSYPGRKNGAAAAEEIDFGAPGGGR